MNCQILVEELRLLVLTLAGSADHEMSAGDVEVNYQLAPHRPPRLPPLKQAIYIFFYEQACLKVGKAGPNSNARFTSQHYGPNAASTLPKSIIRDKGRLLSLVGPAARLGLQTDDEREIGEWLKHHTSRVNILLPASAGRGVLSLTEVALHRRLQPLYEGTL